MAIESVPINSGTGPSIAVDSAGGYNYQVIKLSTAGDGSTGGLFTGTMIVGTALAMPVLSATNVTIASITTGTVNVAAIATGTVTVKAITTGTVDVIAMPVISASDVTIASVATGTVDVVALPVVTVGTVSDVLSLATGTVDVVSMPTVTAGTYPMAHPQRIQFYQIATTSAEGGVIIQTSGGHTIYITDLLISADGPLDVTLASETTSFGKVYLATKGGYAINQTQPYVCTTAQSFRVILSSSGACAVGGVGYTVT